MLTFQGEKNISAYSLSSRLGVVNPYYTLESSMVQNDIPGWDVCLPKRYILAIAIGKTNPTTKMGASKWEIDGGIPNVWSFACLRAGTLLSPKKWWEAKGPPFYYPRNLPTNAEAHYLWRGCLASSLHHPGFLQRSVAWPQRQRPIFHPTPPKQNGWKLAFLSLQIHVTGKSLSRKIPKVKSWKPPHTCFRVDEPWKFQFWNVKQTKGSTGEGSQRNPWKSKLRGPLNVKQTRPVFKQNKSWNVILP